MVSCYYSTAPNMYSRYHHQNPTGSDSPPSSASSAQQALAVAAAHQFQTHHHHGGTSGGHHPQVGAGPPPMATWYPAPPTAAGYHHHTLHHQTAGSSPHHTHYGTMAQAYSPGNEDQLVHPFFHHAAGQFAAASAAGYHHHHGTVPLPSSSLDGGNLSAQQAAEYGNHGSPAVTVSGGSGMSSPAGGASTGGGGGGGAVVTSSVESNLRGTPLSNAQQQTVVSCRPTPARSPYEWIKKTSYQTQPNPGKTRTKDKYRVVYSDHQRVELEKEFYYSRYITIRRKAELARELGLSERQVKIWFQNRRAKERKQVKKREEFSGVVQSRRSSPSMTASLVVNRDPLAIHGLTAQQHHILHGSGTGNQGPATAQMGQSLLINSVEGMTLM